MLIPFPLQCWDVIAKLRTWLQQHCKREEKSCKREQNVSKCYEVFVWPIVSIGTKVLEHAQEMPSEMSVVMLMKLDIWFFFLLNVKGEGKVLKEKSCVQK